MAMKRIKITSDDIGGKRQGDYFDTSEKKQKELAGNLQNSPTPPLHEKEKVNQEEMEDIVKTTVYFSSRQDTKIREFIYQYSKQRGVNLSPNDIIRYLIDSCSLEQILHADILPKRKKKP